MKTSNGQPNQASLFNLGQKNEWETEWIGMPEYDNREFGEPAMTATFKFETEADYQQFYELVKEHLYHGDVPFSGRQTKNNKTTWYPPRLKRRQYIYVDES